MYTHYTHTHKYARVDMYINIDLHAWTHTYTKKEAQQGLTILPHWPGARVFCDEVATKKGQRKRLKSSEERWTPTCTIVGRSCR